MHVAISCGDGKVCAHNNPKNCENGVFWKRWVYVKKEWKTSIIKENLGVKDIKAGLTEKVDNINCNIMWIPN